MLGMSNRSICLMLAGLLAAHPGAAALPNLALGRESVMVRFNDSVSPASYGNDGNLSTEAKTFNKTVDGFWEVDLGDTFAVYGVTVIAAAGLNANIAKTVLRFYDGNHQSIHHVNLSTVSDGSATFEVDLPGPICAQYVRVGLEGKTRTPTDGTWYIGVAEVQVYGRPCSEVGIMAFNTTTHTVTGGTPIELTWQVEDVDGVDLYPGVGPVNAQTDSTGLGSIEVIPAASTEYLLVATNACPLYTNGVAVLVDGNPLEITISEFVADNRLSMRDGYGDAPDWVELHNPNDTPADLTGYALSDNTNNLTKWIFPTTQIPPHGFLVVFASGDDDPVDPAGYLHADWKLDADGGDVLLTAPDGHTILDRFTAYPAQDEDLAYGRDLHGATTFLDPTPGGVNAAPTYQGWLHPLGFSHARGFYTNAFDLAIADTNTGSTVHYSLDGTPPAIPYPGSLTIPGTRVVRAAVTRPGYRSPRVQTHSYLFVDDVVTSPVMNTAITLDPQYADRVLRGMLDLPSIVVATTGDPSYTEQAASVEILWPDGSPSVQTDCGVLRYGGAYTTFAKKNYRLKFRETYGNRKLKAPLLDGYDRGFPVEQAFDSLDLRSGSHDMIQRGFYMANRFVDDTMLDMGSLNPHGRFVHLYFNNTYWGQYQLRERMVDHFLADYLGGPPEDYVTLRGNDNIGSSFIQGMSSPPNHGSWERVLAHRDVYQDALPYLDGSHFIDFMLLWLYGNCESEFRGAGPVDAGSGFKFWLADADGYLRTSAMGSNRTGNKGPGELWSRLNAEGDPDFKTLLADRIFKHFFHDGALTPTRNSTRLAARMGEIADSLIAECARWGYRTPANWVSASNTIQSGLFPGRTSQLFGYLRSGGMYPAFDPPAFNQRGGTITNGFEVTMTTGSGTIYYTLDGSDPRLPGGGISSNAVAYAADSNSLTLVPMHTTWRYWDQGGIPAGNWRAPHYDDALWPTGAAPLGYGDGDETTVISYGPDSGNKYITSYFRKSFVLNDPADLDQLTIDLVRDDGAVVYLNGEEQFRHSMPTGLISENTTASARSSGSDESRVYSFTLDPDDLAPGTNVVAVEVHQYSASSTDQSFDLALHIRWTLAQDTIVLNSNTVIKTRAWTGTDWSALNEATFLMAHRRSPGPEDLIISEIYYNPPGELNDGDFIEIFNIGTNLVDFSGVTLSQGVRFTFPRDLGLSPGEFVVVVEDEAVFDQRYRDPASPWYYPGIQVAGTWSGALANSGEEVALLAADLQEIVRVPYKVGGLWPERADGKGSSLELRNPAATPTNQPRRDAFFADGLSWQSSSLYHGSPGRFAPYTKPVVINEILAHSDLGLDWIEFYNRGDEAVELFGLYIGDDIDTPLRYEIDTSTVLQPGTFTRFNSDQLGFGFSELGSEALLTEATGTNLYRFHDTVDFPAVDREESLGRYTRSDGSTDFTELRALSPDTTNALPRVGPVVFSEIMYHPASNGTEYVELVNISGITQALYHPAHPTNTWHLSGAVRYTFPAGVHVNPCAPVLVCATNPADFRIAYGVDPAIPVFGPWNGALNNAGESIVLRSPGDPESDGTVPYYRVDHIFFRPDASWPVLPESGGTSLERLPLEAYGNDPAAWRASTTGGTPGQFEGNRPPFVHILGTNGVDEETAMTFVAVPMDPDQPWQEVTLSVTNLPPGSLYNPLTGRFIWIPTEADGPGIFPITFEVVDHPSCTSTSITQVVEVSVREVNRPPVLSPVADIFHPAEMGLAIQLEATDPDLPAQSLAFTHSGLPDHFMLDPDTGLITGVGAAPGNHTVIAVVYDNPSPSLIDVEPFTLTLTDPFLVQVHVDTNQPVSLSFPTLPGEIYELEYTDQLEPFSWQLLQRIESAPGGWMEITPPPGGPEQRFYRTRWIREP